MPPVPLKPSAVDLTRSFPPLAGVLRKTEIEALAAILITFLREQPADEFRPVQPRELGDWLQGFAFGERMKSDNPRYVAQAMATNPFADWFSGVDRGIDLGLVEFVGTPEEVASRKCAVALTEKAIEALAEKARF